MTHRLAVQGCSLGDVGLTALGTTFKLLYNEAVPEQEQEQEGAMYLRTLERVGGWRGKGMHTPCVPMWLLLLLLLVILLLYH